MMGKFKQKLIRLHKISIIPYLIAFIVVLTLGLFYSLEDVYEVITNFKLTKLIIQIYFGIVLLLSIPRIIFQSLDTIKPDETGVGILYFVSILFATILMAAASIYFIYFYNRFNNRFSVYYCISFMTIFISISTVTGNKVEI